MLVLEMKPANSPCGYSVSYDKDGNPRPCGKHGYVEVKGAPLCLIHFGHVRESLEYQLDRQNQKGK